MALLVSHLREIDWEQTVVPQIKLFLKQVSTFYYENI